MNDIYLKDEFEKNNIIEKLTEISEKISDSLEKPIGEVDKNEELKLYYQQLLCGMKLSVGSRYGI